MKTSFISKWLRRKTNLLTEFQFKCIKNRIIGWEVRIILFPNPCYPTMPEEDWIDMIHLFICKESLIGTEIPKICKYFSVRRSLKARADMLSDRELITVELVARRYWSRPHKWKSETEALKKCGAKIGGDVLKIPKRNYKKKIDIERQKKSEKLLKIAIAELNKESN